GCHEVISSALGRLRDPSLPTVTSIGFVIIGFTLAINVFVVWVERREGRRLGSELLESDAAHTASDVAATVLVLGSFLAVRAGIGWADVAAAGIIVVLIGVAGVRIVAGTLSTLAD